MAGIRKDIAALNGPWAPEVLWYAKAVGALNARAPDDRTSWRYLGAIHGINVTGWVDEGVISAASDLPPEREQEAIFNQCQHAGWFFLPWHRGYLAAFEAILDDWISTNGGPADWALPYWNYLDATNPDARKLPQEFKDATLPDGTPNPLSQAPRHGTDTLGPQTWLNRDITLAAQTATPLYTAAPGTVGYGGAISGFAHQGNLTGGVEGNPHNLVHVMLGGLGAQSGWMSDPAYAALDPIFWLHHCNIDRLWEAWMSEGSNQQELSSAWKNGPFPQQFLMPNPAGGGNVFVPGDTLPGERLAPQYDDIHKGTGIAAVVLAAAGGPGMPPSQKPPLDTGSALLGANEASVEVTGTPVTASVEITPPPRKLTAAAPVKQRYFLNLEGVRGLDPSGAVEVYLVVPDGDGSEAHLADTLVFFGLGSASSTEGRHAGNGLSAAIDITDLVKQIGGGPDLKDRVEVQLKLAGDGARPVTVEKISIYAQDQG